MVSKGFFTVQATSKELLFKVDYTNDKEKLYPKLLKEEGDGFSIALGLLGKHKNLHWEFQKEWRYILNVLPFNLKLPDEKQLQSFQLIANKMRMGLKHNPLKIMILQYQMKLFRICK